MMQKQTLVIRVEIDNNSPYHSSVGTGDFYDLIEGDDRGLKVIDISEECFNPI